MRTAVLTNLTILEHSLMDFLNAVSLIQCCYQCCRLSDSSPSHWEARNPVVPRAKMKLVPYLASRFYAKPHWWHIHSDSPQLFPPTLQHHVHNSACAWSTLKLPRPLSCLLKEVTDVRLWVSLSGASHLFQASPRKAWQRLHLYQPEPDADSITVYVK